MRQFKDNAWLIMDRNPACAAAEEYRALRTRLELAAPDGGRGTLAVASPEPQDGRTTVAANLAIAFARAGKRTLLVDADLRRPRIHDLFLIWNRTGLIDALHSSGESSAESFIQDTHIDRLHVLAAGNAQEGAPEQLSGEAMGRLLGELKTAYDIVIVDTPPALAAAEASAVAARCDGVLLVARAGKTTRRTMLKVKSAFEAMRAHVRGVVLNRAKRLRQPDALRSFSGKERREFT